MDKQSICILPQLNSTGGPSTFQAKLKAGLSARGIEGHHEISREDTQALLVTGGTRDFGALIEARRRGIRIVQRLDGMNWLHKCHATGLAHTIRSERMNLQLAFIRRFFADRIVYQSAFTQGWWNRVRGNLSKPSTVIHNGVDLAIFSPSLQQDLPNDVIRILVVEGSFKGGHERDLLNAVEFANALSESSGKKVDLLIAGNVPEILMKNVPIWNHITINWLGVIPHERILELDRSAHLFFPAEINAACPNSVVEALACGLPVVGYATGSIPELVGTDGGAVVPYEADHWKLEKPTADRLVKVSINILEHLPQYQKSARERAEARFGLDKMVEDYLNILLEA